MISITEVYRDSESFLHRRDARAKLLVFLALAVCLSTSGWFDPPRLGACAAVLGALLALGRIPPGLVVRRSLIVLPFLLVPVLSAPFLKPAGAEGLSPWLLVFGVGARSWLAALALVALMACTRYADLLEGAARLGVPRILVTLGGFLYRYLFVLVEEAGRMLLARDLRGGGRAAVPGGARVAGAMVAALFLRTYERAERIHLCMLARGFEGEARRVESRGLSTADWAFLLLAAAAVGAAFLA